MDRVGRLIDSRFSLDAELINTFVREKTLRICFR